MAAPSNSTRVPRARPALWAGLSLLLVPRAEALELGEIRIASALGEPLAAAVPVALASGESLVADCVRIRAPGNDLASIPGVATLVPAVQGALRTELQITSARPLFEPVYALNLEVNCPGAPVLVRQYVLMLDLPGASVPVAAAPLVAADVTTEGTTLAAAPIGPAAPAPSATADASELDPSRPPAAGPTFTPVARYEVRPGDTLWAIATRVSGEGRRTWAIVDAIFAANPAAFIGGDRNRLRAGAILDLPGVLDAATRSVGAADAATTPAVSAAAGDPPTGDLAPAPVPVPVPAAPTALAPPGLAPGAPTLANDATAGDPAEGAVDQVVSAPVTPAAPAAVAANPGDATPVPSTAPAASAARATVAMPGRSPEPNPLVAVVAGLAFGLALSGALWSRRARDALKPARRATATPALAGDHDLPAATRPVTLHSQPQPEPAFSVTYGPAPDDLLAREFDRPVAPAGNPLAFDTAFDPAVDTLEQRGPADAGRATEVTSELEELFNAPPGLPRSLASADATLAARPLLDRPEDETLEAPRPARGRSADTVTVEQPQFRHGNLPGSDAGPNPGDSATIDLHALVNSTDADDTQAATLRQALSILEKDYEAELTASQILDRSAVRAVLDPGSVRAALGTPAPIRKRG